MPMDTDQRARFIEMFGLARENVTIGDGVVKTAEDARDANMNVLRAMIEVAIAIIFGRALPISEIRHLATHVNYENDEIDALMYLIGLKRMDKTQLAYFTEAALEGRSAEMREVMLSLGAEVAEANRYSHAIHDVFYRRA